MTRSEKFIAENRRTLQCAAEFWNRDSCLMDPARFETAHFKWLVVFPADAAAKGKSMTRDVLNYWAQHVGLNIFVDFCYLPTERDCKVFRKAGMPLLVGNITHLDASHYDGIGFSIGLNHEALTAVGMLETCRCCDTPIPLTWSERKDLPLSSVPLIWLGGMAATVSDICFGDVDDRRRAFFDFITLGDVDGEAGMFRHFIDAKKAGYTVQQAIDTFWKTQLANQYLYQPQAYRVTYRGARIVENVRINENAPVMCMPYHGENISTYAEGSARTVIAGNGTNVEEARAIVSIGCSGGGACSFCHEGAYSGGYLEVAAGSPRYILAKEARRNTAAATFRPWGFNLNYLSHLRESLYDFARLFPRVGFNNMRMEELGRDADMFEIMQSQGVHHLMAPLDGISDKLRNGLLNKNLSQDAIDAFFRRAMVLHPQVCKVGIILTGYEDAGDWAEFKQLQEKIKRAQVESEGVLPIRYKATMLIHYPHTAVYWLERKAARMSYLGEQVPAMQELARQGVRIKTNGFRYATFLEQVMIDLGRSLTRGFYAHFVARGEIVRSYRDIRSNVKAFGAWPRGIEIEQFFAPKDVYNTITPVHRIYIPALPHILQQAAKYQAMVRGDKSWEAAVSKPCIANDVCYMSDNAAGPVTIYGDAEIQPDGTLAGTPWLTARGCEVCGYSGARRRRVNRTLREDKVCAADFRAIVPRKPQLRVRFQLTRPPEYEALNPRNTAYIFASALLTSDSRIEEHFLKVDSYNTAWMSENGYQYPYKGTMLVDMLFDSWAVEKVLRDKHYHFPTGHTYTVNGYSIEYDNTAIQRTDYNIFTFSAEGISPELWEACVARYDGKIRVVKYGLRSYEDGEGVYKPIYRIENSRIYGFLLVPCAYSPWAYLHGIYHGHSRDDLRIYRNFDLACVGTIRMVHEEFFGEKIAWVTNCATGYTTSVPFVVNGQPSWEEVTALLSQLDQ